MLNVPTSLNDLKTRVNYLKAVKLKTVSVDLKKNKHVADNDVMKNTKLKILKTKVNEIDKKILDATTLIYINQYNTNKQNLEKKIGDVDKKLSGVCGLATTTVLNTELKEVDNKYLSLVA